MTPSVSPMNAVSLQNCAKERAAKLLESRLLGPSGRAEGEFTQLLRNSVLFVSFGGKYHISRIPSFLKATIDVS